MIALLSDITSGLHLPGAYDILWLYLVQHEDGFHDNLNNNNNGSGDEAEQTKTSRTDTRFSQPQLTRSLSPINGNNCHFYQKPIHVARTSHSLLVQLYMWHLLHYMIQLHVIFVQVIRAMAVRRTWVYRYAARVNGATPCGHITRR